MLIPGWVISLATFPGVIVHEIAHRFFADIAGVPVYKICYFRVGNPAGYVIHKPAKSLKQSFLISIGPLIINTVLCALITFPAVFPLIFLEAKESNGVFLLLAWVGYSIGMHAFPSNQDMNNFLDTVKATHEKGVLFIFARMFGGLLVIANALRIIWFDAIYAFGVSMILPSLVLYFAHSFYSTALNTRVEPMEAIQNAVNNSSSNDERSHIEQAAPIPTPQLQPQKEEKINELERKQKEEDWMKRYNAIVDSNIFAIGMVEDHGTSSCDFARSTITRKFQEFNTMRSEINGFTSEYQRGNFGWLLDVHVKEIKEAYSSMCPNSIQ